MTDAQLAAAVPEDRSAPALSLVNIAAGAVFACAAIVFVLFFVTVYEAAGSGEASHLLFGLWGLYWNVLLAWGVFRIRPRGRRPGVHDALMWALFAQGFFLVLFWGALLIEAEAPTIGYTGLAAALAGPLLAIGLALVSRRWLILLLAEILGPAAFWALNQFGG